MHRSATFFFVFVVFATVTASARPLSGGHIHQMHRRDINVPVSAARRCRPHQSNSTAAAQAYTVTYPDTTEAKATTSSSTSEATATTTTSSLAEPSAEPPAVKIVTATVAKLADLLPDSYVKSWTTSTQSDSALPLSDATLRPHDILSALTHNYVTAPDSVESMEAKYPQGSYTFTHGDDLGGFSFYAPGPASVDLTTAKEASFGYSVYFPENFEFQKGGKLPGLYGGDSDAESIGCSGGSRSAKCFSARLMWRTDGAGELYTYLPPSDIPEFAANAAICDIKPVSECNPTYGASVGRGSFSFAAGQRTYVKQVVRLNDPGMANGRIDVYANGALVISAPNLILIDSDEGRIRGMQMQTFFGGSTDDYASPQDQSAFFSDMTAAIIA